MKRQHLLRNFALLGTGAIGLAMLVPSQEGSAVTPQAQRSSVASSPKLLSYLEAQLRPVSTQTVGGTEGPSLNGVPGGSRRSVESPTAKSQLGTDVDGPRIASTESIAVAASAAADSTAEEQVGTDGDVLKVAMGQSTDPKPRATKVKAFLLANDAVLRSSPSKGSTKLLLVQGGTKLSVAQWDGSWARVILANGTSGWINAR